MSTFQFHQFFSSVKCENYVKLALRTQGLPPALRALRRESHRNLLDYVNTQWHNVNAWCHTGYIRLMSLCSWCFLVGTGVASQALWIRCPACRIADRRFRISQSSLKFGVISMWVWRFQYWFNIDLMWFSVWRCEVCIPCILCYSLHGSFRGHSMIEVQEGLAALPSPHLPGPLGSHAGILSDFIDVTFGCSKKYEKIKSM